MVVGEEGVLFLFSYSKMIFFLGEEREIILEGVLVWIGFFIMGIVLKLF